MGRQTYSMRKSKNTTDFLGEENMHLLPYSVMDEKEVIGLARARDRDAMHYLYLKHRKKLESIAFSHMYEGHDFQDLNHEAVVGFLDAVVKFDSDKKAKLGTYHTRRSDGAVLDYLRRDAIDMQMKSRSSMRFYRNYWRIMNYIIF